MKSFGILRICLIASFFVTFQEEVLGQPLYTMYGGAPITYDSQGDDDLGLLLTVLLLAARNKNSANCNCCNCCNCGGGSKNIPVPYPIPFPTNNPIINNQNSDTDDDESYEKGEYSKTQTYKDKSSVNYTLSYMPVPGGQSQPAW